MINKYNTNFLYLFTNKEQDMYFFFIFVSLMLISKNAFAYLDPGSVTYVLQLIVAAIAGGFVTIGIYWEKCKIFIIKIIKKTKKK